MLVVGASGAAVRLSSSDDMLHLGGHVDPRLSSKSRAVSLACTDRYRVQPGDTCISILEANNFFINYPHVPKTITAEELNLLNQNYFDPSFSCTNLDVGEIICLALTPTLDLDGNGNDSSNPDVGFVPPIGGTVSADPAQATSSGAGSNTGKGVGDGLSGSSVNSTDGSAAVDANVGCMNYINSTAGDTCHTLSAIFTTNAVITPSAPLLYWFQRGNGAINCQLPIAPNTKICIQYNFVNTGPPVINTSPQALSGCVKTIKISQDSTCAGISRKANITVSQLTDINLNLNCGKLWSFVGTPLCVDHPSLHPHQQPMTTTTATTTPKTSTTSSFVTTEPAQESSALSDPISQVSALTDDHVSSDVPVDPQQTEVAPPPPEHTEDAPSPSPPPPPPPPSTNPCKSCNQQFSAGNDYGNAHSWFRSLYGQGPLMQDSNLAADALETLNLFKGGPRPCGDITHDLQDLGLKAEGENLFVLASSDASSTKMTVNEAVNAFMSEDQIYFQYSGGGADPANAWTQALANSQEVGHFTQIVWAPTTSVGCNTRVCTQPNGWTAFMVSCRYKSRGNIFGNDGLQDPFTATQ